MDWDNYSSPPSFSTSSLEKSFVHPLEEGVSKEEHNFLDEEDSNPVRRSKRVRKRYPYRGIGDYIGWNESDDDDDIWSDEEDNYEEYNVYKRQPRTLIEASNLGEVLRKGEQTRMKRTNIFKVKEPTEVSLPFAFVQDFSDVLNPTRPIVPELVQTDRCQFLDEALYNLPLVPRRVAVPREIAQGGGDDGGTEEEGDGPPEEGGVRQIHI